MVLNSKGLSDTLGPRAEFAQENIIVVVPYAFVQYLRVLLDVPGSSISQFHTLRVVYSGTKCVDMLNR